MPVAKIKEDNAFESVWHNDWHIVVPHKLFLDLYHHRHHASLNSYPIPSGIFNTMLKFNVPLTVMNILLTTLYFVKFLSLHY